MPKSAGRWFSGVAKVLSAMVSASCARARTATARRSVICSIGLPGDSTGIRRVCGVSAFSNASGSAWSTRVVDTPRRGSRFGSTDAVPPYVDFCPMTWSPADTRASTAVVSAAIPDAVTMAASVCSSSATTAATCAWFGLPKRVWKSLPRGSTATCANVSASSARNAAVRWMGGATARLGRTSRSE